MKIVPYLNFAGNCREAVEFYKRCFDGDLFLMTYGQSPQTEHHGANPDAVMHATVSKGGVVLQAADVPGMPISQGNNFSLALQGDDLAEAERLFAAIGEGGKITMPIQPTFWAAGFGMLTDKFGINWLFNVANPAQK